MIILGIFCVLLAFTSLSIVQFSAMGAVLPVFWAAVASVLIAKGIDNRKRKAQKAEPIAEKPEPVKEPPKRPAPRVAHASVVKHRYFPVAGVTFHNDDGTSRQKILRELCDGDDFGYDSAWLEWYKYKNEDAYRVMTSEGCVGNVRRSDIREAVIAIGADTVGLNIETFENDDGKTIYRADLVVDV